MPPRGANVCPQNSIEPDQKNRAFRSCGLSGQLLRAGDATLAARGKSVFGSACSECHGSYGDGATYPNLLIPVADVGVHWHERFEADPGNRWLRRNGKPMLPRPDPV